MMGAFLLGQIPLLLEEFARAGGGGSGGGGSGGSGGGGGLLALVALLGFVPVYFLGRLLRLGRYDKTRWMWLQALGWTITSLIAITLIVFAAMAGVFAL